MTTAGTIYEALIGIGNLPQGRLTLASATPVMTTTQAAKTTIYYTPYIGNKIPLWDGTKFVMTPFNELSIATTDTTKNPAAIGASKVNDWYVWLDGTTVRLSHGPDWTNDTTRSAGTALVRVNGIWLNNAAITNGPAAQRGTYVGTTRSNASSTLDWIFGDIALGGIAGNLAVWNCYNRVKVTSVTIDSTASFAVSTNPMNWMGSANNRCSFVCGLAEDFFDVVALGSMAPGAGASCIMGIGFDTTAAYSGQSGFSSAQGTLTLVGTHSVATVGYHFWQMLNGAFSANALSNGGNFSAQLSSLNVTGRM
jgi:hypothetical protein